ncbi:hypothetical protein JTE90_013789 [Oedothorax gibbosus]|uniref:Uncharacterized protein n=1 Tax=Oedothorax gibbosus TaxID=931172 RepID=A0AAV6TJI7_9ARAC|nr:hypothetical protein JTE90_013789 [Oedothorax gibbosus]
MQFSSFVIVGSQLFIVGHRYTTSSNPKKKLPSKIRFGFRRLNCNREVEAFCLNGGKGAIVELKQFRKSYYVGFAKIGAENEIRNRFNFEVSLLPNVQKALEAVQEHLVG